MGFMVGCSHKEKASRWQDNSNDEKKVISLGENSLFLDEKDFFPGKQITSSEESVYTPQQEDPPFENYTFIEREQTEGANVAASSNQGSYTTGDMFGVIVYNGEIYSQIESTHCDDEMKKTYYGQFLGSALANIPSSCGAKPVSLDETLQKYNMNFSSNITGDIYAVNGHDVSERICIPEIYEGCEFIMIYGRKTA